MTQTKAPRLRSDSLSLAKPGVRLPQYDRSKTSIGIVHFGPGAFHRGHQACYFDWLLEKDPRWAISGAELLPNGLAEAAVAQDHLYVVAQLDAEVHYRVVGSHSEYLKAHGQSEAIFQRLLDPKVKLVTSTVTEKGYYIGGDGTLDLNNPAIKADLETPSAPKTLIGWITEGLYRRKAAGMVPFVPVSCDNMVMNGHKLHGAVLKYAEARGDKDLLAWITDKVVFPSTMVDSITPAATDALKERIEAETGLRDEAPVQREAFLQWVVEDILGEDAPDLASVGVLMTKDVAAYEFAKLRLLNGAHSTLAYAGLMRGRDSVGEAMSDKVLAAAVEKMMREDMVPTLRAVPGFDFQAYISDLLNRFRNPALTHKLIQIASDGSLKLPIRILGPLEDAMKAGRPIRRFTISIGAWMRFVVRQAKAGVPLADPIAAKLAETGLGCTGAPEADTAKFFALQDVFPAHLVASEAFRTATTKAYENFEELLD